MENNDDSSQHTPMTFEEGKNLTKPKLTFSTVMLPLLVSIGLFQLLSFVPILFFGLSANREQNDEFFSNVRLVFAGPISLVVFFSILFSQLVDYDKRKKISQIRNILLGLLIIVNILLVNKGVQDGQKRFERRQECIDNKWYTTGWNYDECQDLIRN